MSAPIIYSVLQYKHKLSLGESLNVGVLFYIPAINKLHLEIGTTNRIKSIYFDADITLNNSLIKLIKYNINKNNDLFLNVYDSQTFIDFIRQNIFQEDATGLIFSEPVTVPVSFNSFELTIDEYSKLLLPQNELRKTVIRHDETKIIKDYFGFFKGENEKLKDKFEKNVSIKTSHYNVKFDYKWENGTLNYIKPVSFDLSELNAINNKIAVLHSHLIELNAEITDKSRIDILLAKPQNPEFIDEYNKALDIIDSTLKYKKIVFPDKLEDYYNFTVDGLLHH